MKKFAGWISLGLFLALAVAWDATGQGQKTAPANGYPEPRYPAYLVKPVTSIEELMPNARALVRNKATYQGLGLGGVKSGETILIITRVATDDMVVEAIRRALQERGVKVQVMPEYKLAGVSREDAVAVGEKETARTGGARDGYSEAVTFWINGGWTDQDRPAALAWLKAQRPDLYAKLYPPALELPAHLETVRRKLMADMVGPAIAKYLKSHPEVTKIFWGFGGSTSRKRELHPYESKFYGAFIVDSREELMSRLAFYPADVWMASEQRTIEPVAYVDKVHVTDPEGTDMSWDMDERQAARWAQSVYQRGHLYMHPNQASGRYAYSVVNYPSVTGEWMPRVPMTLTNGVMAGTMGHGGYYPRMKLYYKNGYVADVEGGGAYGEVLKTFLKYPHVNDLTYPYHEGAPGFWWHFETALGTNPKAFRDPLYFYGKAPGLGLGPERTRAGVFHFGQGLELLAGPENQGPPMKWFGFVNKNKLPSGHGFHIHNYFATYQVHLRNTDRWVKLVDRGRLTALDDPEVRALASRYGDPDAILAYDWVPEIPGINAPGRYEDYAKDPWPSAKAVMDKVMAGKYEHYYPAKR